MVLTIYAIFDRLASSYGEPFYAQNDAIAMRRFQYLMANSPMVQNDCELYALGGYNADTGSLTAFDKPNFVGRYAAEAQK